MLAHAKVQVASRAREAGPEIPVTVLDLGEGARREVSRAADQLRLTCGAAPR